MTDLSPATALSPTPAAPVRLPRLPMGTKQAQDTVAGCRLRAEADLTRSSAMDTAHGREKLEHSAATWSARADLLQRIETGARARLERSAA